MGRIVHIEITGDDLESTAAFLTAAFGWRLSASPEVPDYLLAVTGDGSGVDGAAMSRRYQQQAVIPWLQVEDLESTRRAVRAAGGTAGAPVHQIPGQGAVTYVQGPDGVVYGLRQPQRPVA